MRKILNWSIRDVMFVFILFESEACSNTLSCPKMSDSGFGHLSQCYDKGVQSFSRWVRFIFS